MKKPSILSILLGIGLIIFALVPTPDDVTIISPIAIFIGGIILVTGRTDLLKKLI